MTCAIHDGWALWLLGYPGQATAKIHEALTLAQELSHPFSLAYACHFAAGFHHCRQEEQESQEQEARAFTLSTEHGFSLFLTLGAIHCGWGLITRGQPEAGIAHMRQGLSAYHATGAELRQTTFLAMLAEAYQKTKLMEDGLNLITEAITASSCTGERFYEAELYRIKGELLLAQARQRATGHGQQTKVTDP